MDSVFPTRLREAIEATGKTQERVARDVDVSLRTVQMWVAGRSEPRGRQLVRVAMVLDREPSWFYGDPELPEAA